jgi:WD40 repeat protein
MRRSGVWFGAFWATHPSGDWLVAATAGNANLTFWPLRERFPTIVGGYSITLRPIAFSPDGKWLASSWADRSLRLWPLAPGDGIAARLLAGPAPSLWAGLALDPGGRFLFAVGNQGRAWVVPMDGTPVRPLPGFPENTMLSAAAISPGGRYVASAFVFGRGEKTLRVFDLESGTVRSFDLPEPAAPGSAGASRPTGYEAGIVSMAFAGESALYTGGHGGVRRWDLATGKQELVVEAPPDQWLPMAVRPERGLLITRPTRVGQSEDCAPVVLHDLATGSSRPLPSLGTCGVTFAVDPTGTVIATGAADGIVRVGRLSGEQPHLLVGHKGVVDYVAVSPDLKWVASTGEDNTLRLWPMPDLSKAPLHTLPHDALVAKLKSLTNLRAVRDPKSGADWKIEIGPFPGWTDVPSW